ncbi:hypothetical protein [Sinorhizobium meliloti]|nr:hypothetical protein [Sinorhizobium meliloti]
MNGLEQERRSEKRESEEKSPPGATFDPWEAEFGRDFHDNHKNFEF